MVALLPVADPGEKFRVGRGQTFHFFAAVIAAHRHGDRRRGPVENSPHRSRVSPARKSLYCILFRPSHSTSGGFPAVRPKNLVVGILRRNILCHQRIVHRHSMNDVGSHKNSCVFGSREISRRSARVYLLFVALLMCQRCDRAPKTAAPGCAGLKESNSNSECGGDCGSESRRRVSLDLQLPALRLNVLR